MYVNSYVLSICMCMQRCIHIEPSGGSGWKAGCAARRGSASRQTPGRPRWRCTPGRAPARAGVSACAWSAHQRRGVVRISESGAARPRWRCTAGRARQGPYVNSRPARVGGQGEPPRVRGRRRARVSAHVRVRLRGHKPVRTSFVYAQRVAALTYISSRRPSGTSQLYCVHI